MSHLFFKKKATKTSDDFSSKEATMKKGRIDLLPDQPVTTTKKGKATKNTRGSKVQETRKKLEEGMPEVYLTGQEIIDDELEQDSDEMKDVKLKIEMIQSFLSNPMPPIARNEEEEARYKKELEGVNLAINMMYNRLVESMDAWLNNKDSVSDYSEKREELIRKLKGQVLQEEAMFAQSINDYRRQMMGSVSDGKEKTWADMLRFQRASKIDMDSDTRVPEITGGQTSTVIKLKQDDKTYYFKEEENTLVGDYMSIAEQMEVQGNETDMKIWSSFKKALDEDMKTLGDNKDVDIIYLLLITLYKHFMDEKKPFKKYDCKIHKFLNRFDKLTNEERKETFISSFMDYFKLVNQQAVSKKCADIEPGRNLSRRNVATSRLASLFGIGDMFAESRTAVLKYHGQIMTGNLMEDAKGSDLSALSSLEEDGRKITYSAAAEDQLIVLQIFDLLCGQVDRHFGNFMSKVDSSKEGVAIINGVVCIDNDMSFGNMSFDKAQKGVSRLRPLTDEALLALPPAFQETLLSMDAGFMKLILRDILEPDELEHLGERLKGLQRQLKSAKDKKDREEPDTNDPTAPITPEEKHDPEICKLLFFKSIREAENEHKEELKKNGKEDEEDEDEFVESKCNFLQKYLPTLDEINQRLIERKAEINKGTGLK